MIGNFQVFTLIKPCYELYEKNISIKITTFLSGYLDEVALRTGSFILSPISPPDVGISGGDGGTSLILFVSGSGSSSSLGCELSYSIVYSLLPVSFFYVFNIFYFLKLHFRVNLYFLYAKIK